MLERNRLRCETCGKDHFSVVIIEKPLRFCKNGEMYKLLQVNKDGRKQDNICVDCLTGEMKSIKKG